MIIVTEIPKNASRFAVAVTTSSVQRGSPTNVLFLRENLVARFWSAVKTEHPALTFQHWDGESWKHDVDVIACIDECIADIEAGKVGYHFRAQASFLGDIGNYDYILKVEDDLGRAVGEIASTSGDKWIENFHPESPYGLSKMNQSPSCHDAEAVEYIKHTGFVDRHYADDARLLTTILWGAQVL